MKKLLTLLLSLSIASMGFSATKWQEKMFASGDTDKNGSLSETEFVAAKKATAKSNAAKQSRAYDEDKTTKNAKRVFAKSDANANAQLSPEEFYASFPAKKK